MYKMKTFKDYITEGSKLNSIIKEFGKDDSETGTLLVQLYVDLGDDMPDVFEYEIADMTPKDAVKKLQSIKVFKDALGFIDDDEYTEDIPAKAVKEFDASFE